MHLPLCPPFLRCFGISPLLLQSFYAPSTLSTIFLLSLLLSFAFPSPLLRLSFASSSPLGLSYSHTFFFVSFVVFFLFIFYCRKDIARMVERNATTKLLPQGSLTLFVSFCSTKKVRKYELDNQLIILRITCTTWFSIYFLWHVNVEHTNRNGAVNNIIQFSWI